MANNHIRLLAIVCFLCFLHGAYAQQGTYYIKDSEDGAQFIQQFSWDASPDVLKYGFYIERRNEDGSYTEMDTRETETNMVELSLSAGEYRYKIQVYNLLGIPELETDWKTIEIIKAYQPEIRDVSPRMIYLEEKQDGIYSLTGADLLDGAEFELVASDEKGSRVVPGRVVEHDSRNRRIRLAFDVTKIDVAEYTLVARNPGGLTAKSEPIIVRFMKPMDFDVSAGYSPVYVLNDDTIEKYFGSRFWPMSATVRFTFIPVKRRFGYFGAALGGSYFHLKNEQDGYTLSSHVISGYLDFVYQKPLYKRRVLADIHAGAGITGFSDMKFELAHNITTEPLTSLNLSLNAGVALQFYVQNRLYIEIGCDFTHVFISDMALQYVQPTVSCGWQF